MVASAPLHPMVMCHPRHLADVLGKRAATDIKAGTPLTWEMVAQ